MTSRRYNPDVTAFPKWCNMLARSEQWKRGKIEPNKERSDVLSDIAYINASLNDHIVFKHDGIMADHWQSPDETRATLTGDCEDIAICKYHDLYSLGIDDVEIVVVVKRASRELHAVCRVFLDKRNDEDFLVLDNIEPRALMRSRFLNLYEPIYAINLKGWRRCSE
jgi:predicted transglutaminase-like cysteine proteinase